MTTTNTDFPDGATRAATAGDDQPRAAAADDPNRRALEVPGWARPSYVHEVTVGEHRYAQDTSGEWWRLYGRRRSLTSPDTAALLTALARDDGQQLAAAQLARTPVDDVLLLLEVARRGRAAAYASFAPVGTQERLERIGDALMALVAREAPRA